MACCQCGLHTGGRIHKDKGGTVTVMGESAELKVVEVVAVFFFSALFGDGQRVQQKNHRCMLWYLFVTFTINA